MLIESLQNKKVKFAVSLRDRRDRDREGLFLIEGYRELLRAVDQKREIHSLFICPDYFLKNNERALIDRIQAPVFTCTKEVFQKLSYRDRPDGLLAISPQVHLSKEEAKRCLSKTPFVVVAESIEKPGNLGTILRSSDAAGVDLVIVADPKTDIYNPNVVRSSVGTLFTVPILKLTTPEALEFLKEQKILQVAATPHAENEYTRADFTGPLAIVMGTEQYGLSKEWMEKSDIQVKIPMLGIADSLNVASATTLMLYEVVRQRRNLIFR